MGHLGARLPQLNARSLRDQLHPTPHLHVLPLIATSCKQRSRIGGSTRVSPVYTYDDPVCRRLTLLPIDSPGHVDGQEEGAMKAAIVHEPGGEEALYYEDVPDPKCGPEEVRIRVRATALNRADLARRAGLLPGTKWPLVIGWDVAGEVESVGSRVEDRKVGERVVALIPQGGYAELATSPSKDVVPLPDNVSFDEAAALPVAYLTAWYGLRRRARVQAGEVVLISAAASGVGVGGIQMAKNLGATVIATVGTDTKVEFCKRLGADHAINYRERDFAEEVSRITNDGGVNVVLESVGGEMLTKTFDVLAPFGRLISVGIASGQPGMVDSTRFLTKGWQMEGFLLLREPDLPNELANLVREVSQGRVKAVVDKTYPLSEAGEAHRYLEDRRNIGKVILHP